jgi:hypothetical protein
MFCTKFVECVCTLEYQYVHTRVTPTDSCILNTVVAKYLVRYVYCVERNNTQVFVFATFCTIMRTPHLLSRWSYGLLGSLGRRHAQTSCDFGLIRPRNVRCHQSPGPGASMFGPGLRGVEWNILFGRKRAGRIFISYSGWYAYSVCVHAVERTAFYRVNANRSG